MILVILLSCCTIIVSATPVTTDVRTLLVSQRRASQAQGVQPMQATNQKPKAQPTAQLSPSMEQPQPGVPRQQMVAQGGQQLDPSLQHYTLSPLGGSLVIIPLQLSVPGSQPANQQALPQQPPILPPYGYFLMLSPPSTNQPISPDGFPVIREAPLPQTPENQAPISPVLPAEAPSGIAPVGDTPQPVQQQQNPQIVYMLQQPMTSPLGSLSSEELEVAAKMGQLGMYVPTVLTNLPAGSVQPVGQAAGLTNRGQAGIVPTRETSVAAVPQTEGSANTAPHLNANNKMETAAHQTAVRPKLQPRWGNRF